MSCGEVKCGTKGVQYIKWESKEREENAQSSCLFLHMKRLSLSRFVIHRLLLLHMKDKSNEGPVVISPPPTAHHYASGMEVHASVVCYPYPPSPLLLVYKADLSSALSTIHACKAQRHPKLNSEDLSFRCCEQLATP